MATDAVRAVSEQASQAPVLEARVPFFPTTFAIYGSAAGLYATRQKMGNVPLAGDMRELQRLGPEALYDRRPRRALRHPPVGVSNASRWTRTVRQTAAGTGNGHRLRSVPLNVRLWDAGRTVESCFVGQHDGLCAVSEAEFSEDVADVRLYGRFGEDELVGDLAVAKAARDEAQHLNFARGQLCELGANRVRCRPA